MLHSFDVPLFFLAPSIFFWIILLRIGRNFVHIYNLFYSRLAYEYLHLDLKHFLNIYLIRQFEALREQERVLLLGLGQETDVQVRRLDGDPARAGRIQARHGLLDVLHGIGILQFLAQFDHPVGQGGQIHPAFIGPGQPFLVTPRQEHQRHQHFPTVSHSTFLSSDAKLGNRAVLKKY